MWQPSGNENQTVSSYRWSHSNEEKWHYSPNSKSMFCIFQSFMFIKHQVWLFKYSSEQMCTQFNFVEGFEFPSIRSDYKFNKIRQRKKEKTLIKCANWIYCYRCYKVGMNLSDEHCINGAMSALWMYWYHRVLLLKQGCVCTRGAQHPANIQRPTVSHEVIKKSNSLPNSVVVEPHFR